MLIGHVCQTTACARTTAPLYDDLHGYTQMHFSRGVTQIGPSLLISCPQPTMLTFKSHHNSMIRMILGVLSIFSIQLSYAVVVDLNEQNIDQIIGA